MDALAKALSDVLDGNDESKGVKTWLDTGFPPLNRAVSGRYDGGLPCGRIVELFGDESCGKTAIATACMIAAQRAGGVAMFNDHERSFMPHLAENQGLDLTPGRYIYKTPDSFEGSVTKTIQFIKAVRERKLIDEDAPIVVVFDSLASMVPQSKLAKEVDEQGMNDSLALAKATSSVFPVLALEAEKNNTLILVLNQMREKPGVMFGDPNTTPGGKAPKFYASVRIQVGRSMIKSSDKKRVIGQEITAKCIKNKVSRPFELAKWKFMFRDDGSGYLDAIGSGIDHLCEEGILTKAGNRIEYTDGKKYLRNDLIANIEKDEVSLAEFLSLYPTD